MPTRSSDYADEIALRELAMKIWGFYRGYTRKALPIAVLCALLVAALVSLRPLYNVTAILDTPQLSLNDWRSFSPLLADKNRVQTSLSSMESLEEREGYARSFIVPKLWESSVQYKTALRRDDVKEAPNAEPKKTDTLGLEVSIAARDEKAAAQRLEIMAHHIRQTMIWFRLTNYLQEQRQQAARQQDASAIELIQQQFTIDQSNQRIAEMQKLLDTYPELRGMDTRAVISVENGGGKYLSPLAQIVALKATISEANATMRAVRRKQEEMDLRGRFLASIGTPPALSGSQLSAWLKERKKAFFASVDMQSPVAQEVSHDLDLHFSEPVLYAALWQYKTLPASFNSPILLRRPIPMGIATFLAVWLLFPLGVKAWRTARPLLAGVRKKA